MADTKMSKNEAVRLALVELGEDASRAQIQAFVKERFGFEMTPNHISAAKGPARQKLGATPKPKAQPAGTAPASAAKAKNGAAKAPSSKPIEGESITKKEAVRRALATLGKKAKPLAIQGWIKDNLHLDLTTAHISTTKGELLRKPTKKPSGSKPAVLAEPAMAAVKGATEKGVQMDDILKLKELVGRVGPKHLHILIDVMSK
jgi:hypothetical protein